MNTAGIFNFNICKCDDLDGFHVCSFNWKNGIIPDDFNDKDSAAIDRLFRSVGLDTDELMENHYAVPEYDVQRVGDAFVKIGLDAVLPDSNNNQNSTYPLPDGSIPGIPKPAIIKKKGGLDEVDRRLLELMGGVLPEKQAASKSTAGKVTTENCAALLAEKFGGKASDWKRRSKKKVGKQIIRIFEYKDGNTVEVVEEDGSVRINVED